MSFTFNFVQDDSEKQTTFETIDDIFRSLSISHEECKAVHIDESKYVDGNNDVPQIDVFTGVTTLKRTCLHYHTGIDKDTDLISGVYEGGYKVWECSLDLVNYMLDNESTLPNIESSVLELGCGHGYPGIAALKLGYKSVVFSDLNAEVLIESTWPNIYVNCPDKLTHAKCFAGDWLSLSAHLLRTSDNNTALFEFVVSAETLYSVDSCRKLFYMLEKHLSPTGLALVATKRFYFGVGGGTSELMQLVAAPASTLSCVVVKEFVDGASNIREILCLRRVVK